MEDLPVSSTSCKSIPHFQNWHAIANIPSSIAVSICYWLVAASIAELASAMPSASGGMSMVITILEEFQLSSVSSSLSLGIRDCRKVWPPLRVVRWLVEYACLDLRSSIHVLHSRKSDSLDVRLVSP